MEIGYTPFSMNTNTIQALIFRVGWEKKFMQRPMVLSMQ